MKMNRETPQWIVPVVLAVAVAAALWFYWQQNREPEPAPVESTPVESVDPEAELQSGPRYPVPDMGESVDPANLQPLPPLDDSDEYFRLELRGLYGDVLVNMLVSKNLIERIVATVDNLPRAHVAEKIRPVGKLDGAFPVNGQDGSGEYTLSPENYARYDRLVSFVTSADINNVADTYRRYYPLFQKAYVNLGYPDAYFNDRLIEVIDHLLDTPAVEPPVVLGRPNVLYKYANAELEARSSGQKLLIRMGNDHAERVKNTLREFRTAVLAQKQ
jgi:hypothetical protein